MAEVHASMEKIRAVSGFAADRAEEIRATVAGFAREIEEFCGSGWQGQASDAFVPLFSDWQEQMVSVAAALARTSERLETASVDYSRQEDSNESELGALAGHVGAGHVGAGGVGHGG